MPEPRTNPLFISHILTSHIGIPLSISTIPLSSPSPLRTYVLVHAMHSPSKLARVAISTFMSAEEAAAVHSGCVQHARQPPPCVARINREE